MGSGTCLEISRWEGKKHSMAMTCESGRRFKLSCDTEQECDRWQKAFSRAVALNHRNIQGLRIQKVGPHKNPTMQPGKVALGDFHLLQTVGKGGFGKVLLVQHGDSDKVYAMKILKKQHVVNTHQIKSTAAEKRILQNVEHPFIVKLRYAFQSPSKLYMVMDYYSGGSLYYHVERNGVFSEPAVQFFAAEITLALGHLHQHGIIYRDLKLENILLDGEGHVALTDFGLSKDQCDDSHMAETFCGTPVYVAPEVVERQPYSFSVDWWALGIVMYELMSGRLPFASRDRRRMFHKIVNCPVEFGSAYFSPSAQSIIGDLLIKDPSRRLGCVLGGGSDGKAVQCHKFFAEHGMIDFHKLLRKEMCPPFKPSKYVCENNVRGVEAKDTHELCETDVYNFANFTFVEEESPQPAAAAAL
jgi:serine/threonine protein kinase